MLEHYSGVNEDGPKGHRSLPTSNNACDFNIKPGDGRLNGSNL